MYMFFNKIKQRPRLEAMAWVAG